MKKFSLALLTLILITALAGCSFTVIHGSGHVITESRQLSGVTSVNLTAYGELNITQGSTESFSIQGDDNIVPHILSEVDNGVLTIRFDDNWGSFYQASETLQFNLTVKNVNTITFSGAGKIKSSGLTADDLTIALSGAGDVQIENLQVNSIEVSLSGAGNVRLSGTAVSQKLTLSGVGNYNTQDLKTQVSTVSLTGAGNASIWVTDTLDVHISGAGSVNYYGKPVITKEVSGVGSLNPKGEK